MRPSTTRKPTAFPKARSVQVFRQGYRLREKIIRPAQVVVAKRAGSAGAGPG